MRQYVGVILVNSEGAVLSQHRDDKPQILGPNTWCVVGGAREKIDEDTKAAAIRELKEETGYVALPNDLELLDHDEYTTEKGEKVERIIYWGKYDGHQPIECYEGQEIRFVYSSEFGSLPFYTGHENFFRKATERL